MIIVNRVVFFLLLLWIGYEFATFPVARAALFGSFIIYIFLLWRFSSAWLIVLPAILPVLDLTPWSGRLLITEFDLFIAATLAVGLFFNRFSFQFWHSLSKPAKWLFVSFVVSQLLSLMLGFINLQSPLQPAFFVYHSQMNSFRVAKGFLEALLLLPMLSFEKKHNKPIGRYFSIGMITALSLCIISITWERLFFPGLLDFKSNYRVSGMFSGMLLGGALLDGFLALAFPFFITCFLIFRNRWLQFLGVLLFAGGIYCYLVTFTRTTYLALLVIFIMLYIGTQKIKFTAAKSIVLRMSMLLIVAFLVIPVIGGDYIQKRFSTTIDDFKHRLQHWNTAIHLMDTGGSYLWGMGTGTFPKTYFENSDAAVNMSGFRLYHSGNSVFLHFDPSDRRGDLYIHQRFHVNEIGQYELRIKLRSWSDRREKLLVELCERNIMPLEHECNWREFPVNKSDKGRWVTVSKRFDSSIYHSLISAFKPLEISIMNRGLKGALDIGKVEIYSPSGQQVIKNPDFSNRFDYWVFSNGNHLAWHIKNIWVSAFFEGGIIELILLSFLLASLLRSSYAGIKTSGNPFYLVILSSISAFIIVGLFGSVFDDPRVSWLFFTITSMVIVKPENPPVENNQVPWLRLLMGFLIILLLLVVVGFLQLMHTYNLSATQLVVEAEKRLGVNLVVIRKLLEPKAKFVEQVLDGHINAGHPRILFGDLQSNTEQGIINLIRQRVKEQSVHNSQYLSVCGHNDLLFSVVCWLSHPNDRVLNTIKQRLVSFSLNRPSADTTYSNAWQLALAYDLMFYALPDKEKISVEKKLVQALKDTLLILDEDSASLWHGRSTHAAIAWLCAVVLPNRIDGVKALQRRAQGHFLTAIDGLGFTTIWPGGYNYWIQARAFQFALASSAYLNGLREAGNAEKIKQVMSQIGYWTIYATRPDNRIEGFGDEGSRVDLKDETRRVIDLIVQMTRDPVLAGYSEYLAKLHGLESYYRGYRWGFLLFNDPTVWSVGDGTMESLGKYLPVARLFGAKTTNYAYFRSGWGKEDTFISFKAGHTFSHHGHYDAGHFTIFKDAPLVVNSSTYGGFFTPNRLNYSIRTIAKNSLIIQRPNEIVRPNRFFNKNVADGGQRLTMPTGSAVLSVGDWFNSYQQGQHYEGAELNNFSSKGSEYAYISVNLAPAYNNTQYDDNGEGGKVSEAVRQLLYLPKEDILVVFDQVTSTHKEFLKKWLLHTVNQPRVEGLTVLKGTLDNGISESRSNSVHIQNGKGRLRLDILYPDKPIVRLLGGKDYQYYVEVDGDDTVLNGINFNQGSSHQPWFDNAKWRIEIQPETLSKADKFLMAMSLSEKFSQRRPRIKKLDFLQKNIVGLVTEQTIVVFLPAYGKGKLTFSVMKPKTKLIVAGVSLFKKVDVVQEGTKVRTMTAENGVAYSTFDFPLQGEIELRW